MPIRNQPHRRPYYILLAALIVAGVLAIRWQSLGSDWSSFATIGKTHLAPASDPAALDYAVWPDGYDGQAFFYIAHAPFQLARQMLKGSPSDAVKAQLPPIQLDNPPMRIKRLGYPATAWLLSSGGQPGRIPLALVLANALAAVALVLLLQQWCRRTGATLAWSLFPLAFIGLWICLFRDLSDALAVLLGLCALWLGGVKREPIGFAVLGSLALLTKETTVFLLLGAALPAALQAIRPGSSRKTGLLLLWALPFLLYMLWSYMFAQNDGGMSSQISKHFTWPAAGIYSELPTLNGAPRPLMLWASTFAPVMLISWEAGRQLFRQGWREWGSAAWAFALNLAFGLVMSAAIYEDHWSFGRNLLPLQCSAFLVLLSSRQSVSPLTLGATLLAAAYFIRETIPNP